MGSRCMVAAMLLDIRTIFDVIASISRLDFTPRFHASISRLEKQQHIRIHALLAKRFNGLGTRQVRNQVSI
jgi:hypothetical protein